jgi:tetratricopeptide (TPR) repeat protein
MKVLLLGLGDSPIRSRFPSRYCENDRARDQNEYQVLTFGYQKGVDIRINIEDDFSEVLERLPEGWDPDFCLLWNLDWNILPRGIEYSPVPTIATLLDWDTDIPISRHCMDCVDLIIALSEHEKKSLEAIGAARIGVFFYQGVYQELFKHPPKRIVDRRVDLLVTGLVNDFCDPTRSKWIMNLCSLSDQFKVQVEPWLPGHKDYLELLGNAKLVLSHHRMGRMSARLLEAGARGSVVVETGAEPRRHFLPDEEYIPVDDANFRSKIEQALKAPDSLQKMADRFRESVIRNYDSANRFVKLLEHIGSSLPQGKPSGRMTMRSKCDYWDQQGGHYYYLFFRNQELRFLLTGQKELLQLSIDAFSKANFLKPGPRIKTNLAIAKGTYNLIYCENENLKERTREAIDLLQEVIAEYPQYGMAFFNSGLLHLRVGNHEEALKYFQTALRAFEAQDSDIDAWCLQNRDFDLFNQFMRRPLNENLLLLLKGGQESVLSQIRVLYQAFTLYLISLIEGYRGNVEASLNAALDSDRRWESGLAAARAGRLLAMLGDKDRALDRYRRALKTLPLNIDIRFDYARLLYYHGMDHHAAVELNQLVRIVKVVKPLNGNPRINRGIRGFRRLRGNLHFSHDWARENLLNEWVEDLTAFLRKAPGDLSLVLRIVELWRELGRLDQVFELVECYLERHEKDVRKDPKKVECLKRLCDTLEKECERSNFFLAQKLDQMEQCLSFPEISSKRP